MNDIEIPPDHDCVDYEDITVTSAAIGLTATKVQPVGKRKRRLAVIHCKSNPVHYRNDPSAASVSATVGTLLDSGETLSMHGANNLSQLRFFATGSDATLSVHYYD